ncbi:MAG: membrane dipeptidase [Gammaproteobacteria bacterium]|nr:membrane dipeptidase [Gammaproteobacteria bacterium]MDH4254021.1 membrane dipeptidase [Gammaproteobacteria bacterium]MDH5310320.1 membrane dipeptidase [Gammaproteobacteria bacterium]
MITRRDFSLGSVAGAMSLAAGSLAGRTARAATPTQDALIIDAMGEIREAYTDDLVREMIGAGMNSVTVTLCDPKSFEQQAYDWAMDGVLEYDRLIGSKGEFYLKATSAADIARAREQGKIAIFYLFQNSTQFGRDLDTVDIFYGLGVRSSQITYNWQNWAGAGCMEENGSGLTRFGHELVEKMNAAGMLIDLSHAGMRTMADTIAASRQPVIISHTCCKALNPHPRNTTDENMRAAADRGGLVGITQMRPFMTLERDNAVHYYYQHIEHAVKTAGIDHVCIGSDRDHRRLVMTQEYLDELKREEGENFNPDEWPLYFEELNGPRRMETIWDGLAQRGMSEGQLEKIFGLNILRLYEDVIG